MKWRVCILLATIILVSLVILFLVPAIPQSEVYHKFADDRPLLGVPNCLDVISNVLFLVVGLLGLRFVSLRSVGKRPLVVYPSERWVWLTFFSGITLTAFGSAYYHLNPNDSTLVWDRIPMAISFMALVVAVVAERISVSAATRLLAPLLVLGAGSVIYWRVTQANSRGDLRPYILVQFGSLSVLVMLLALFKPRYTRGSDLIVSLGIYALAKIFEAADLQIFTLGGFVSGHTFKHIAAAISAYWILRMLQRRVPIVSEPTP